MLRLAALLVISTAAWSQTADTVLLNGKILTVDSQFSTREAIAIRGGRILATSSTADIRKLAGPATRTIDLQGRTVIPGLIDSHLHAIRAALSFSTEVNWIGARSLPEALGRIRDAARTMKPRSVADRLRRLERRSFQERRRPTQAELVAAAPNNPVYVQLGYGWAILTPAGLKALNIRSDADLPSGGKLDPMGKLPAARTPSSRCSTAFRGRP
jgi:predicted amidohydrolase YtcJ